MNVPTPHCVNFDVVIKQFWRKKSTARQRYLCGEWRQTLPWYYLHLASHLSPPHPFPVTSAINCRVNAAEILLIRGQWWSDGEWGGRRLANSCYARMTEEAHLHPSSSSHGVKWCWHCYAQGDYNGPNDATVAASLRAKPRWDPASLSLCCL